MHKSAEKFRIYYFSQIKPRITPSFELCVDYEKQTIQIGEQTFGSAYIFDIVFFLLLFTDERQLKKLKLTMPQRNEFLYFRVCYIGPHFEIRVNNRFLCNFKSEPLNPPFYIGLFGAATVKAMQVIVYIIVCVKLVGF